MVTLNTETAILGRLIDSRDTLSRDVAEYLLSIDFEASDIERMNLLAVQLREGNLMPTEATELDSYLYVVSLLSITQSKARRPLKDSTPQEQ